jgi:carboxylate-amine ligase
MAVEPPAFTVGIEEEYLLVDRDTLDLVKDVPEDLMRRLKDELGDRVGQEFMRSQVEIQTHACPDLKAAAADLKNARGTVCELVGDFNMAPIASSTHPFADWGDQMHTDKERYNMLARDMQGVVRRLLISGMHVHVGVHDNDLRIDLINQISYFLPHLLALSTSSPFWRGHDTGLKSYRTAIFKSLPRTGLPQNFSSWAEYERHVNVLVDAGIFEDATKVWWDIRPSARFPTIELRIPDLCTSIDDAVAISAAYMALLSMLWRKRQDNQRWRTYSDFLVSENVWRAQRYGISESLMDFGKGELVPVKDLVDELITLTARDAELLGCALEVEHLAEIVRRGTSADRQLDVYNKSLAAKDDKAAALHDVVEFLVEETRAGL